LIQVLFAALALLKMTVPVFATVKDMTQSNTQQAAAKSMSQWELHTESALQHIGGLLGCCV